MRKVLTMAAVLALTATTAPAQTNNVSGFVLDHVATLADGALDQAQLSRLAFVAHQAVMAAVCDGIVLNADKFQAAFVMLGHPQADVMSPRELAVYEGHLMFLYGMATGGLMAEIADAPGEFCANALAEKDDPEMAEVHLFE